MNTFRSIVKFFLFYTREKGFQLLADLPNSAFHYTRFPSHLANTEQRPDLILINDAKKKIIIGELTSPMESNLDYQNQRKLDKYSGLANALRGKNYDVLLNPFEVSARGFVTKGCTDLLKALECPREMIKKIGRSLSFEAISRSKLIFNNRFNKNWRP